VVNGNGYESGGGLDAPGASPPNMPDPPGVGLDVAHNVFTRNTGKLAGGAYVFGPAYFHDNVFFNNSADSSGAVRVGPNSRVVGNTVVANSAGFSSVLCGPGSLLANNIVAFNYGGASVGIGGTMRDNCLFGYEDVGYVPSYPDGNIHADPHFAAWRQGDLRLQPDSPCMNAGDNSLVNTSDRDAGAAPRVRGAGVDIGALESDGTVLNVPPRILHVSTTGDDANDGLSWERAKKTVGGALEAVSGGGDVWVAEGIYPREWAFQVNMPSLVRLYGGFQGDETDAGQRDPEEHPTILEDIGVIIAPHSIHGAVEGFTIRFGSGIYDVFVGRSSPNEVAHNEITGGWTGILLDDDSRARIHDNVIRDNIKAGIASTQLGEDVGRPLIVNNHIVENDGVGVDLHGGEPLVDRNVIRANAGGGIQFLGDDRDGITVSNNLVDGNGNETGGFGGIRLEAVGDVINNTIVNNDATPSTRGDAAGILLYGYDHPAVFANNIVAFNIGKGITMDQYATTLPILHGNDVFGNAAANYQRIPDPTGTDGNISADPLFVDRPGGDYHLLPGSPAVDTGGDTVVPQGAVDLDGALRIQGAHVDIGAYELAPPPGAPIDAIAALRFAAGFQALTPEEKARLNVEDSGPSEGVVDLLDALQLLRLALQPAP
jgi:hypothetical protein